ncbi:MAG: helix-turn-helix transcriptional regulator [Lachnospiraceae bacterium]|nr:helix-turn-helix transcriptional regulator [Lachnospiraceae bacterium]
MKFEEKLIMLRKSRGMSQEDLAEKLQVSRQAVSRWESGATWPDVPNLIQLSDLFGVTTDYLAREKCEEKKDESTETNTPEQDKTESDTVKYQKALREKNLRAARWYWKMMWVCIGLLFVFAVLYVIKPLTFFAGITVGMGLTATTYLILYHIMIK